MKILIVEDEMSLQEVICEVIRGEELAPHLELITANDGLTALQMVKDHGPDMVITDIKMPKLSGVQMITQVRQAPIKQPEVIVMTGFADIDMAVDLMKLNVLELLRKPFDPHELVLAVRKTLDKMRLRHENEDLRSQLSRSERLSAVGMLAAGIAHEINNPNTFVKANWEVMRKYMEILKPVLEEAIQRGQASGDQRLQIAAKSINEAVESGINGSDRIATIVRGLLSFAGNTDPTKTAISIQTLLDEAKMLTSHRISSCQVSVNLPPELPKIVVNPQEIVQVFMNLILNAADAIEDRYSGELGHGKIDITASVPSGTKLIRIRVTDNGTGVRSAVVEKIFDPFITTKPPGKGTGLGLSVTKGNVEGNGGKIFLDSTYGDGAAFIVEFPVSAA